VLRAPAVLLSLILVAGACSDGARSAPATTAGASTPVVTTQPAGGTTTTPAAVTRVVVGTSRGGLPISARTLGVGDMRLYVIGSMHGPLSPVDGDAVADRLSDLPPGVTVRVVDDANPDGTAAGSPTTAAGVDLGLGWGGALGEPEVSALTDDIEAFRPAVIVVFDAASDGRYVSTNTPADSIAAWFGAAADVGPEAWPVAFGVDRGSQSLEAHFEARGIPVVTAVANRWDDPSWLAASLAEGVRSLSAGLLSGEPPPAAVRCDAPASCSARTARAGAVLDAALTGGDGGFLLKRVGGPVLAAQNAGVQFYPASAIKTVHLLAALRFTGGDAALMRTPVPVFSDSCAGTGPFVEQPMGDLLDRMLLASDNEATNALQGFFGLEALNALMAGAGMDDSALFHRFGCGGPANDPANVTTAADLVALYDGVRRGALLPAPLSDTFFALMLNPSDGPAAPAAVPIGSFQDLGPGVDVSVKAGWFGTTLVAGGVVDTGDGPLAFAVWTDRASALTPGFEMQDVVVALLQEELAP